MDSGLSKFIRVYLPRCQVSTRAHTATTVHTAGVAEGWGGCQDCRQCARRSRRRGRLTRWPPRRAAPPCRASARSPWAVSEAHWSGDGRAQRRSVRVLRAWSESRSVRLRIQSCGRGRRSATVIAARARRAGPPRPAEGSHDLRLGNRLAAVQLQQELADLLARQHTVPVRVVGFEFCRYEVLVVAPTVRGRNLTTSCIVDLGGPLKVVEARTATSTPRGRRPVRRSRLLHPARRHLK